MDTNYNPIMIDFVRLNDEVRKKAKEYLGNVSEDSLRAFAESTKSTALSVLENYFFDVDDFYTKGAFKINDDTKFNDFIDFQNGYRSKMKKWASENEIAIQKMTVSPSLVYPMMKEADIKKPVAVAGIGTLVAFGLYIFTNMWIAVAAELLALGTAAYLYKNQKQKDAVEYEFQIKKYNTLMEQEKERLVNGLITDLKTWLERAVSFSDETLKSFGI